MKKRARTAAAALLLALGLLQMAGDVAGLPLLKGIGAATVASPAPRVFSAVKGFETYSTRFYLEWTDLGGIPRSVTLTSTLYARLRGPYNRRNVYGAALAYGPVMPAALRDPVMRYALCGDAPVLRELGFDPASIAGRPRVRFEPRPGTTLPPELPLVLEAPCP